MPRKRKITVTVFRPRLEMVQLTVMAQSEYDADNIAFEMADTLTPEQWKMLPPKARFHGGTTGFDEELFITDLANLVRRSIQEPENAD